MTTLSCATTRKQPSFPAYLRLTRLPSTYNILFCKSIKPAFDLKQSKPIIPSTVICATNACTTISFVSSSLIRKLPRPEIFNLSPLAVKTS